MVELLKVSSPAGGKMDWKVTAFTSPLTGTIMSAQLRDLESHYPIKASQQMLELQLQTSSVQEMHDIQEFIRRTQVGALGESAPLMTMWWPVRNIENWTGIPMTVQAGGERFIQAATMNVRVQLVDSLISERTFTSSSGSPYENIVGTLIKDSLFGNGKPTDDTSGFVPPAQPSGPSYYPPPKLPTPPGWKEPTGNPSSGWKPQGNWTTK